MPAARHLGAVLWTLLGAVLCCPLFAAAQERVDLRPRFTVGEAVRFELVTESRSEAPRELEGLGLSMPSTSLRLTLTMTPTEAGEPGDGATVRLTIDRLVYETDGPEAARFDSTRRPGSPEHDPANNPLHRAFSEFMQHPMTVRMDGQGNVTGIDAAAPGGLVGSSGGGLGGANPGGVVTGAVRQLFGPITTAAPQSGFARVGETWTTRSAMPGMALGGGELVTEHRLVTARRDQAVVGVDGTFRTGAGGLGESDARFKGEMVWDRRAQMIDHYEGRLRMVVRLPGLPGDPGVRGGEPEGVRLDQTMQIRRLAR